MKLESLSQSDAPLELCEDSLGEPEDERGDKDARWHNIVSFEVGPTKVRPYRIKFLHRHGFLRHVISLLCLDLDQLHLILVNHVEDFGIITEASIELSV